MLLNAKLPPVTYCTSKALFWYNVIANCALDGENCSKLITHFKYQTGSSVYIATLACMLLTLKCLCCTHKVLDISSPLMAKTVTFERARETRLMT